MLSYFNVRILNFTTCPYDALRLKIDTRKGKLSLLEGVVAISFAEFTETVGDSCDISFCWFVVASGAWADEITCYA